MVKELNPSPRIQTGIKPELSPNPNQDNGLIDETDEKPNTQIVNEPKKNDVKSVNEDVNFNGRVFYHGKDIGSAFGETGKVLTNVTVNNWVSDATYVDYPYKADINFNGIKADDVVEVIFALAQATSGNYAPVCLTGTDKVTIYSKVNTTIVIPTIKEVL